LEYLQDKQDYQQVSEKFIQRVSNLARKNKTRLIKSMAEDQVAFGLIKKARTTELTTSEKERVREVLIKMLKTLPSFVIIALPQKFLTLPILLKILPKNIFAEGVKER
jgi:hypothetical protein